MGSSKIVYAGAAGLIEEPGTENELQEWAFRYMETLRLARGKTFADFAYAVPNGTMLAGNAAQRARMMNALKKRGLRVGIPDICIPYPGGGYHGAYIEVKRLKDPGEFTEQQQQRIMLLCGVGYYARLARGFAELKRTLDTYHEIVK